ncbi:MAG: adenosine kinase [Pseudomonadales bacterium]|nr:adenosine kinase [Pseudomonadales bacterium]
MEKYDVYGVGNALVDTEYEVHDKFLADADLPKGMMTLIEAEERKKLIWLLEEEPEHEVIKLAGGGSAANTIVAIAQFGGRTFYSCKVASDEKGDFFMHDLKDAGVSTNLDNGREPGVTGECISMVTPDAERTMTTCLGITQDLSPNELVPDALKNSTYLYIEGYLVSSPSGFQAALEAQKIALDNGVSVSLTLSDPAMVDNFKTAFDELIGNGVDLLFCNEEEARLWTGKESRDEVVETMRKACPKFAITCGKEGALVCDGNEVTMVEGVPAKAVDTTGAGDMFAGAFLYAICNGSTFPEAAALANRSAALLVTNFGARLTPEDVRTKLAS